MTYLPVFASRHRGDLGKEVEIPLSVEALTAVASRATGEALTNTGETRDGDEAVTRTARRQGAVGLGVAATLGSDGGPYGGELAVGSEDSGHVERADMASVVRLGRAGRRGVLVAEV